MLSSCVNKQRQGSARLRGEKNTNKNNNKKLGHGTPLYSQRLTATPNFCPSHMYIHIPHNKVRPQQSDSVFLLHYFFTNRHQKLPTKREITQRM